MAMTVADGARRIVTVCAGVQPGERVAVLLDDDVREGVAGALADAVSAVGAQPVLHRIDLAEAYDDDLLGHDVMLGLTGSSLYHSDLGRAAAARGTRVLALTACDEGTFSGGAIEADFAALEPRALDLSDRLGRADAIEVTTPRGFHLTADISGREGYSCTGRATTPGSRSGCPDIEAYIAAVEDSVEGTVVVDGSSTPYGLLDEPVTITVAGGRATDVKGGEHADLLRDFLDANGPDARTFAEFGFGLNPCAKVIGKIIEDEATYGTGHVAFGSNESFGGHTRAPIHLDLVYWHPTLTLDGVVVMRGGVLEV
ncbi:MAG: hypothetical protein GEV10_12150 [Streptosporangiales bacterium]|nr:hypothetical protein [Streptosporangiales bacterium]